MLYRLVFPMMLALAFSAESQSFFVNRMNRGEVERFYYQQYCPGQKINSSWKGDIADGEAGEVSSRYKEETLRRVKFFRAMAGVPVDLRLREDWERGCAEAALMMSANADLDHYPSKYWLHYTRRGAEAARYSNLSLGHSGPDAINGQMRDEGAENYSVGHRRWLLFPHTREIGFGAVVPQRPYPSSAVIRVLEDSRIHRPYVFTQPVAWPPEGYVPAELLYPRWSFSLSGADFSSARVVLLHNNRKVPLRVREQVRGMGDATLVWEPEFSETLRGSEHTFFVQINKVRTARGFEDFSYYVVSFEPGRGTGCAGSADEI